MIMLILLFTKCICNDFDKCVCFCYPFAGLAAFPLEFSTLPPHHDGLLNDRKHGESHSTLHANNHLLNDLRLMAAYLL